MKVKCDNCGAPLVAGRCEYCRTTWYPPELFEPKIVFDRRIEITSYGDTEIRFMSGLEYPINKGERDDRQSAHGRRQA